LGGKLEKAHIRPKFGRVFAQYLLATGTTKTCEKSHEILTEAEGVVFCLAGLPFPYTRPFRGEIQKTGTFTMAVRYVR
jgi:hypothetical protein